MSAFREGLTRPSWTALLSLGVGVGIWLGLAGATAGPAWLEGDGPRWLAAHSHDDDIFVAATLEHLDELEAGSVVLVGASGMREAYTGPRELERALASRVGHPVDVWDLSTDGQTLSDAMLLVDRLPQPCTVVVGIALLNFVRPDSNLRASLTRGRLGIRSAAWAHETRRWGGTPRPQTGVPFLDQFSLFAARLPRMPLNLLRGPIDRQRHRYLGVKPPARPEPYDGRLFDLKRWKDRHIQVVLDLAVLAEDRGHDLVILETPMNERIWGTADEAAFFDAFAAVPEAFRAAGLNVQSLPEGLVSAEDFADPIHLNNTAAQARVTEALADLLAKGMPRGG